MTTLSAFQTTLARPVSLAGIGVHSGKNVRLAILPAEADQGIAFRRTLESGGTHEIPAVSSRVVATDLCTVLGTSSGVTVGTVEHMMASLSGLGVDNAVIELDGAEVPIMDGSASAIVEAIDGAGLVALEARRRFVRILRPVRVEMGGSWGEFVPYDGTRFEIDIDFDNPLIGRQAWKGDLSPGIFRDELARSRTFGFMRDVERLWAAGFALGASLENAIVVADDNQVINAGGLRFPDEFVRHKALDAVGDLALIGAPFLGCFRSYRGGHKLNALAVQALLDDMSAYQLVEVPVAGRPRRSAHGDAVAIHGATFSPWSH